MRIVLSVVFVTVLLLLAPAAYSFSTKGEDCAKCHNLTKEDAATLLRDVFQSVNILEVRMGPVKGVWEVDVESGGKKGPVYVDFSKKHLISGSIFEIKGKKNLTQQRAQELNKVDVAKIPLDDAIVMGEKTAKHRVIVFDDPDWPYCVKLHQEMKKVIAERKDIVFYIKMFPLPMHKEAYGKSKAIICEKSLKLLEDAFEKKPIPEPKCDTKAVDENIKLAEKLGISGTPALIFPNGTVIPGAIDAKAIIEQLQNK